MIAEAVPELMRYAAFGMDIRSEVPLPLLSLSTEGKDASLDSVQVILGQSSPSTQSDCLARVSYGWGEIVLLDRHTLSVNISDQELATHAAGMAMISTSVSSTGMAALMYANDLWPVHASAALSPDGYAVLLVGRQGAGKSTMATGLVQRGWQLISDDCSSLAYVDDCWRVFPGTQKHKLTEPARKQLGMADLSVSDVPMQPDKKFIEQDWYVHRFDGYQVKAATVLLTDRQPKIRPLHLPKATKLVARFAFRKRVLADLIDQADRLRKSLSFCQSVSVHALYRNDDLKSIDEDLARLLETYVI